MRPYYEDDLVNIYHGDAREVLPSLPSLGAEMLWTDPPYGVEYVGKTPDALTISNDGKEGLQAFLVEAFAAARPHLAPGARFYVAAPAGPNGTRFRLALEMGGYRLHQTLVWVKHALVLGHSDYHYQHEDILYGWLPGPGRVGRGAHEGTRWYGDNSQSSVFFIDRPKVGLEHPTIKPLALISRHLRNSTRPSDLVLDPFMGSGSTLRAAKNMGRRAVGIEIEERYCDAAARWLSQEALDFDAATDSNGRQPDREPLFADAVVVTPWEEA